MIVSNAFDKEKNTAIVSNAFDKEKNNSIDSVYLGKGNDAMIKLYHPPISAST